MTKMEQMECKVIVQPMEFMFLKPQQQMAFTFLQMQ